MTAMVSWTVTWGLLIAWTVHDAEELYKMPHTARNALAIGLMGVLIAVASYLGVQTGGRSPFFQIVLIGFGVHAIFHVGATVVTRGYTPGVITAVLVVAPFGLWAWMQVRQAGIVSSLGWWLLGIALLLLPVSLGAVHGIAIVAVRLARRLAGPH